MNLTLTREQLYPSHAREIRREQFIEYLERATQIVKQWPQWKKDIFGRKEQAWKNP